jgi:threonine/homoserine/homoserine lactone efflux protein
MILFLCCVVLFILASLSLLCGAYILTLFLAGLFYLCYWAIRYEGPKAKHHVIHFANNDGNDGGDEYNEPKPFVRENFKFN